MLENAIKAIKRLSPEPNCVQAMVDDGVERYGASFISTKVGDVYLIGGYQYGPGISSEGTKNDAWKVDVINVPGQERRYRVFSYAKEQCEFSPRSHMATCSVSDGTIYLTGGRPSVSSVDGLLNDMWKSSDGLHWELVCKNCPWTARYSHSMAPCGENGDLLLMAGQGGHIEDGHESFNDVWRYIKADNTWSCATTSAEWRKRASAAVRVGLHGAIVLCGGQTVCPEEPPNGFDAGLNDVWMSSDQGKTWQCTCKAAPVPGTMDPWFEYLPQNECYIWFGRRHSYLNLKAQVYTSKDLVNWDCEAEEVYEDKFAVVALVGRLEYVFMKQDGTLVLLTRVLN